MQQQKATTTKDNKKQQYRCDEIEANAVSSRMRQPLLQPMCLGRNYQQVYSQTHVNNHLSNNNNNNNTTCACFLVSLAGRWVSGYPHLPTCLAKLPYSQIAKLYNCEMLKCQTLQHTPSNNNNTTCAFFFGFLVCSLGIEV